jgi:hypothetical protein
MSQLIQPLFNQNLGALDKILDKLAAHAQAKNIDPAIFLAARLYPDMFPFTRQVQVACDFAKGCVARLSGSEVPSWEDNEKSIEEIKARVGKTLAYVNATPAASIDGSDDRIIRIKLGRNAPETEMTGTHYLVHVVLPNFFFHTSTAYAILRHNGVEIGKGDFLGRT